MQKIFITILNCCFLFNLNAQKTSGYFTFQYNSTIHDITSGNNPWSIGIGTQMFLGKSKVRPTFELTGDRYLYSDKLGYLYSDGTIIDDVGGSMINLFPGVSYHFTKNAFISFSAGPSLIGKIYFGIKPSAGFYFSQNQKWFGKISYINIFNRDERTREDFSSASISIGVKMF